VVAEPVTIVDVDRAIAEARSGRRSHVLWQRYRLAGGIDDPGCGDAPFHAGQVAVYDERLRLLRELRRLLRKAEARSA